MTPPADTDTQGGQEWEIGVRRTDTGEWEHYHPQAETEDEAIVKARESATRGLNAIGGPNEVYMVAGPFETTANNQNRTEEQ